MELIETILIYSLILIAAVLMIFIWLFIAVSFEDIANAKGWHQKRSFHLCFWLGIIGMLYVIALPDRGDKNPPAPQENPPKETPRPVPVSPSVSSRADEEIFIDCPQCGNICRPQNYCPKCGHQL